MSRAGLSMLRNRGSGRAFRIVRMCGVYVASGVNTSWRSASKAAEDSADGAEREA